MPSPDLSPSFTSAAQLPRRQPSPPRAGPPSPQARQPPPARPLPGQQAPSATASGSGSSSSRIAGQAAGGGSLRNAAAVGGGAPVRSSLSATPGPAAQAGGPGAAPAIPAVAKPVVQQASRTKNAIVVSARQVCAGAYDGAVRGCGTDSDVCPARSWQRGNPIIPFIKGVPWEYGEIVPDYVVGAHSCVLYLSCVRFF